MTPTAPSQLHNPPLNSTQPSAVETALLELIVQLRASASAPKPATRRKRIDKPPMFYGRSKSKFADFLTSLEIHFRHTSDIHNWDDEEKVTFTGSLLGGTARTWYLNLFCQGSATPESRKDYPAFVQQLTHRFGIWDEPEWSERQISALRMSDNQHFDDFIKQFELHKVEIRWSDQALHSALFQAIAPRIRQRFESSPIPIPNEYTLLRDHAASHDYNYWEYRSASVQPVASMPIVMYDFHSDSDSNSEPPNDHSDTPGASDDNSAISDTPGGNSDVSDTPGYHSSAHNSAAGSSDGSEPSDAASEAPENSDIDSNVEFEDPDPAEDNSDAASDPPDYSDPPDSSGASDYGSDY